MKKFSNYLFVLFAFVMSLSLVSCGTDEPDPVTPDPDPGVILTRDAILMNNNWSTGTTANPVHHFYSVRQDVRYPSLQAAKAAAANVDFVHGLRNANAGGRVIASPDSEDAAAMYGAAIDPNNITTWDPRTQVRFRSITMDEATFNAINNDTRIIEETATGVTDNSIRNLQQGSTFAFVLPGGRRGIARVTQVSGADAFVQGGTNNTGSVTLRIKVQE
jgi:hypothetical protein